MAGLSAPAAHCLTRSLLATSERAIDTASQAPEVIASRTKEAVW